MARLSKPDDDDDDVRGKHRTPLRGQRLSQAELQAITDATTVQIRITADGQEVTAAF